MSNAEKKIGEEAEANKLNVNDLGNLVVAMLRENLDDPIGSLIFRSQIEEETEELNKVARIIAEWMEEEYESEEKLKNENKIS